MLDRLLSRLGIQVVCVCAMVTLARADDCTMGCQVQSQNGRFLLTVHRTLKGKGAYGRYIDTSTYTLRDQTSHKNLWTRKWDKSRFFASDLCISDTGLVIGWQGTHVFALEPKHGEPILELHGSDLLSETMRQRYAQETSAGTDWGLYDWIGYFVTLSNRECFVIRTWWGFGMFVDLDSKTITPVTPELSEKVESQEHSFLLGFLRRAVQKGMPSRKQIEESNPIPEIQASVLAVGQLGVTESIPYLKVMEAWDYCDNCFLVKNVESPSFQLLDGIRPGMYAVNKLRATIQLSIRRLGVRPEGLPSTQFCLDERLPALCSAYSVRLPGPREGFADKVSAEMKPFQVLRLIGDPDFVVWGKNTTWEYDMDEPTAYTLEIKWEADVPRILSIDKSYPPKWKFDSKYIRDEMIVFR